MTTKSTKNWALDTAVSVHNENADWFSEQYQKSKDRYASEFIYGRKKMDFYFERELKKLPKGAKILDVGCGTGHQMSDLLQQGFEVLGIEPADNMRAYAQSHLSDKAVLNASVKKLPFESETFDFVYAFEVFRYLNYEDNLLGLAEIRRVLKKGGVFFGSFVNLYALDGYTVLVGIRRLQQRFLGKQLNFHTEFDTPSKLCHKLNTVGFSEVESCGAMFAPIRIAYKFGKTVGSNVAKVLEPFDIKVSNQPALKPFAGHLLGIAKK